MGKATKRTESVKARALRLREETKRERPDRRALVSEADVRRLARIRRSHLVRADQPLVLISQVQRSGGTLLARLFDGHPQCHVHPYELHIGSPVRHVWPQLDIHDEPHRWFATLSEQHLERMFAHGQRSIPTKYKGREREESTSYPFLLPPSLQRALFLELVADHDGITSEREILECYLTSLFNAWLDNQNLYGCEKRWVVAFAPRLAYGAGRDKLFETYPDGRLISIIRDPFTWLISARGRERPDAGAAPERLIRRWTTSAVEMLEAKERHPDRVLIVGFEDLVTDTATSMRDLAGYLGIDFTPRLTQPTFNGFRVGANSSFPVSQPGVIRDPATRSMDLLSEGERDLVEKQCAALYEQVIELRTSQENGRAS